MSLVLDNAAINLLLKGPNGPVAKSLIKKTVRFQQAARRQVNSKTGCLEASILWRWLPDGNIIVISDTSPCSPTRKSYSLFVHEGTAAHDIFPKKASILSFVWPNGPEGNKRYGFAKVHHPGTAPNRFLTDNIIVFKA